MSKTRVKAGVMVAAMFCTSLALAEDGAESVTVKLSGGSTAVGVGANWGDGILTYQRDSRRKVLGDQLLIQGIGH